MLQRPSIVFSFFVTVPIVIFFTFMSLLSFPLDWIFSSEFRKRWQPGFAGPMALLTKDLFGKVLLWVHGVQFEFEKGSFNLDHLQTDEGVFFVSNHQSLVDILILMAALPKRISFIAKKELGQIPFFGWASSIVGTRFIDRSRGSGNRTLGSIRELQKKGVSFVIFAEGTRSLGGNLLPFKQGAFSLAIQTQAPLVPVVIFNSWTVCPKGRLSIGPGKVHLYVADPISTLDLGREDRTRLSDEVHTVMAKQLEKFSESRKTRESAV